jgi:hypothetical protein
MSDSSLGEEIYSGAASFGRLWTLLGAVFGTVVGIILVIVGIYIMTHKDKREEVSAVINVVKCNDKDCVVNVSYNYKGQQESVDINYTGTRVFYPNQKITVYVNPDEPKDALLEKPAPKWMGWIFIGAAVFIVLMSWLWFWFARKYKFVGAMAGVGGALNVMTGGRL